MLEPPLENNNAKKPWHALRNQKKNLKNTSKSQVFFPTGELFLPAVDAEFSAQIKKVSDASLQENVSEGFDIQMGGCYQSCVFVSGVVTPLTDSHSFWHMRHRKPLVKWGKAKGYALPQGWFSPQKQPISCFHFCVRLNDCWHRLGILHWTKRNASMSNKCLLKILNGRTTNMQKTRIFVLL